jgi:hypothetical protein
LKNDLELDRKVNTFSQFRVSSYWLFSLFLSFHKFKINSIGTNTMTTRMPEQLKRPSLFGRLSATRTGSERPEECPTTNSGSTRRASQDVGQRRSSFAQIKQASQKVSHSFEQRVARKEAYLKSRNRVTPRNGDHYRKTAAMPLSNHLVRKNEAEKTVKILRSEESFKQTEALSHQLIAETMAKEQAELERKKRKQTRKEKKKKQTKKETTTANVYLNDLASGAMTAAESDSEEFISSRNVGLLQAQEQEQAKDQQVKEHLPHYFL